VDGVANRTSYLMNSILSHKTQRYGKWKLIRFVNEVGSSSFIAFSERTAAGIMASEGGDPRQDDYDIWLGTNTFKAWIAWNRHSGVANYLYLDGHAVTLTWDNALVDMFPDKVAWSTTARITEAPNAREGPEGTCRIVRTGRSFWGGFRQVR
jgi:prepilin-type processing-associated H-X9-DG protein